jgi:hypothetical protein
MSDWDEPAVAGGPTRDGPVDALATQG